MRTSRFFFVLLAFAFAQPDTHASELATRLEGTSLFARIGEKPEQLLDRSVNAGSPASSTVFEDGTALIVYRGHAADQTRDIQLTHYDGERWSAPRPLNRDDWRTPAATSEGPELSAHGGRVAVTWFTAADNDPRVLLSTTPDAGARFTMPVRVSENPAAGRSSHLLLRDGAILVSWLDASGALLLRRVAANLTPDPDIATLATLPLGKIDGTPRLVLVKDYDATPARVSVVFFTHDSKEPHLLNLTLPTLSSLAGRSPCAPCDEEDAKTARGFSLRGRVVQLSADRSSLIVQHEGIPGVMRAQSLTCKTDPQMLPAGIASASDVLARIERRGRDWWIFDVRLLQAENRAP